MQEIKIIYASSAMSEEDFSALFKNSEHIPGQQAQKFNRLMLRGFGKNGAAVTALTSPPITKKNHKKVFTAIPKRKTENVCYRYLPVVNIKGAKNLIILASSFAHTFFSSLFRKTAVVCDILNVSVAMGAVTAGRMLGKPCIGIVTDIPELMVTGHTEKQVKWCYNIIKKCTGYVFLTEPMNDRLNPENKPYVIVEGVCDETLYPNATDEARHTNNSGLHCFYAGLLDEEYGVKAMVDGFLLADIPESQLTVCGKGPYEGELKQIAAEHDNVTYLGVIMNDRVVQLEKEAALLINPRPSAGEFTMYSFPSKNMEYMTSGTAVLGAKLPGMPKDHHPHMYLLEDESAEGIANALKKINALPKEEVWEKGKRAREFVLREKNSVKQAEKVLGLIEKLQG
ncbi:MAG: glycosyltransferase family 4 protein [Ruminococcaceae bacterium]|nr:glycosyltransferase family 4 protein [Oscillospiraceae bacterium]